jgi:hypothetical protein
MIFKYLKFRENLFQKDGIILRASPRNDLNDPFEFLPPKALYDKIVAMHTKRGTPVPSYQEITKTFFSFHGAISFTESKSNLLMWSHYAYEHKGIVLGFDNTHSFFHRLKRVKYNSELPDDFIADMNSSDDNAFLELFYLKSDEWIYEKEHRIVDDIINANYYIDNHDNLIKNNNSASTGYKYFFVVPYDALLAIYFGCRMEAKDKKKICESLSSKTKGYIKAFEAIQCKASLKLDFKKYKSDS